MSAGGAINQSHPTSPNFLRRPTYLLHLALSKKQTQTRRSSLESSRFEYCADLALSFTHHIHSAFAPLLSLSLYVSPANYINVTRPLYSTLLPWPAQYAVPPARRTAAEAQTEHLGLSGFALDEDTSRQDASSTSGQPPLPPNMLFKRSAQQTVTSLLGRKTEGSAVIRLAALVEAAIEPLDELLENKRFLLSDDKLGALDCVVLGYVSLGLVKDLPSPWLKEGIQQFSKLAAYVERCQEQCFGQGKLKWGSPVNGGWLDRAMALIESIPIPETLSRGVHIVDDRDEATQEAENSKGYLIPAVSTAGAVLAAGAAYIIYASLHLAAEPLRSQRTRKLDSMGETGAMLAGLADRMDMDVQREIARERQQEVEVDVEVEVTSEDSNAVKGL